MPGALALAIRVAVVAAQWHDKVMDGLVDGALRALTELGIDEPTLLRVPGSFELPVVAKVLAGRGYDAVVALGAPVRAAGPGRELTRHADVGADETIAMNLR